MTGEERLSRADAARWHMGTRENPMVIGALLIVDGRLELAALEELVRRKLLPLPRFRQHVVDGPGAAPRWREDAPFDLALHVTRLPGITDERLAHLAGERMSAPLPAGRSPWALELVELASGHSAVLGRIHHCIADGQALVAVLGELSDRPLTPPPAPGKPPPHRAAGWWQAVAGMGRFVAAADEPATRLRGTLDGDKRVAWSRPVALAAIKDLAHARGRHLVDVLLAAVAGLLARYLRLHQETAVDVRALVPIAAPAAANSRAGNHYASVSVTLPVTEPDPGRRMDLVGEEVLRRRLGDSGLAKALLELAGAAAPGLEHRAVSWRSRKASLVVSSLRGPDDRVQLAGHTVQTVVVWPPAPATVALSLSLFGYADELRLAVLADAAVIPDPERLAGLFDEEMVTLLAGVPPRTS
jgi:diacylglycerol O-acyltransferase